MNSTINKVQSNSLILVDTDLQTVKEIVSSVLDSASIRDFKISQQGRHFRIIIPSEYHVPQICLKQLESKGYSLKTLHSDKEGLEIVIGENKK